MNGKRMTTRVSSGNVLLAFDLEELFSEQQLIDALLIKLAYYEDAEEEGRLIVLPKKPERLNLHRAAELILADEEGRVMIWDAPMESPEPKENGTPREASPADKKEEEV